MIFRLSRWLTATSGSGVDVPTTEAAWGRFREAVVHAGLAGLIVERAAGFDLPLPDTIRERLRRAAMFVAGNNLSIAGETERLVGTLEAEGVPVLLLKGAALNLTVYDRPDLRPMSDVDFLVHYRHARRAVDVLMKHGCRSGAPLLRDDFFPKYHYETELIAGLERPVRVDLHARPFRPLRLARLIPDAAMWHAAGAVRIGDAEVFVPSPETMFLHLAAHAAFHGCSRLIWLYDLRRLLDRSVGVMDWDYVLRYARDWRLSAALRSAVAQAEARFGVLCPPEVSRSLAAQPSSWRDRLTLRHAPRDAARPLAHVAVNLLCAPGMRFKLGYVCAVAFPGRSHLAGLYRRRHAGWPACAHAWRACRALGRLIPARRFGA